MRTNTVFLMVLLLVSCVRSVEDDMKVSVMEGDSVTLHTDFPELPSDSKVIWKFGDKIIARINETDGNPYTYDGPDATFKDGLKLDKQTGSLTIANIRKEHKGRYSVDIKSIDAKLKKFDVAVHDEESLSVMEGDSLTLHTGVKVQGNDQILWSFKDQEIPIAHLNRPGDARRNIRLNDQTRDLIISNIRSDQTGDYKMEMKTTSMILHRKFHIAIGGGGVKIVSVMEREPVKLNTGVLEIGAYDRIEWKTEGNVVAEIDKSTNLFGPRDEDDSKFNGRLHLHRETGDLTISESETKDSRDYHLNMSNSAYTLERTVRVIVKTPPPPPSGAASGICDAGVGLVLWALTLLFAARFVENEGRGVSVNVK